MIDIILHSGFPRTATTLLQQNVFPKIQNTQLIPKIPTQKQIQKPHVIISNEMFSMVPERFKILSMIKKIYPQARIILGLRDYPEILYTLYNHLVTYGLPIKREEWEKQQPKEIDSYIEFIEKKFEECYIYHFEVFKRNPEMVINEMIEFIGEPLPDYKLEDVNPAPRNDEYVESVRQANEILVSNYNKNGLFPRHLVSHTEVTDDGFRFTLNHPQIRNITIEDDKIIYQR